MKASIEPAGWRRRNGWYPHCKHSVWISQTRLWGEPQAPGAEIGRTVSGTEKNLEAKNINEIPHACLKMDSEVKRRGRNLWDGY